MNFLNIFGYKSKEDLLKNEFNKKVNSFNTKPFFKQKRSPEKYGKMTDFIKTGIYNNKKQIFRCVQINPFLEYIEVKNNNSSKIDLNKNKKGTTFLLNQKGEIVDNNIYIGEQSELILNSDNNKNEYIDGNISGIFGLFYYAYAHHKNIFIRPDDIWFHIILQLQILIDVNHESLTKIFVNHEGKKNIKKNEKNFNKDTFINFISTTNEVMSTEVNNNYIQIINTKFSSTSDFDINLTNIVAMCSMKHYYNYNISIACGIRNIFFGGELEDWKKIRENLVTIINFKEQIMSIYIKKVIPIIDKFIEAIEFEPDIEFFNKIMRTDACMVGEIKLSYGQNPICNYINGWIIDLYSSKSENLLPGDFKEYECTCDITIENEYTSVKESKTINTSTGIGIKYHENVDGYSLIKAWWIKNK